MRESNKISVDLRQMVVAIESAVGLVGMNDTNHGKRVGYIALQIANHLGFPEEDKTLVFELGLLHDCGVSSDFVHNKLVNQFDWEDSHSHCDLGYHLLKDFEPLARLANPIRHHHTHWSKLQNFDLTSLEKRLANLIFLADRVDVSSAAFYGKDILLRVPDITELIKGKSGTFFDPELIEAFLDISSYEAFWISLEERHVIRYAWDMSHLGYEKKLSFNDLKRLARIFSYIVDQKSAYTAQHSYGVAQLARYIAQKYQMTEMEVDEIEVAGYLHDVGKLYIPDSILKKPGPLTSPERAVIKQHSYETYEILRPIKGLENIAKIAAYHHDNCLGTGYPFHPPKTELSLAARIIAVSDIFQALVQDRPYREGMDINQVVSILKEMSDEGKLDNTVVQNVIEDAEGCFKVATAAENESS